MQKPTRIYGIRAVNSNETIDKVFVQKDLKGALFKELESLLRKKKVNISYVPIERLNRFTQNNHQEAVTSISPVDYQNFEELAEKILNKVDHPLFLLLDQISDVRNFGAIIRTAECTGVDAIIIPKTGSAPINSDTVRTSAGATFNVPIAKVDHLKDAIYYLKSSEITIVAATEKGDNTPYKINLKTGCAIIMGAEDKGISNSILKLADHNAKLPITGKISSLNVSVACGVFLYEVLRQRLN